MNYNLKFLSLFHRHPRSVGSIVPSSRELAEAMIASADFSKTSVVVELGPGIGPITAEIIKKLSASAKYIGIEKNGDFCKALKERFPQLTFVHASAENLVEILDAAGVKGGVDTIICGIPWSLIPPAGQGAILDAIKKSLRPGGVFITYAYISGMIFPDAWAFRRRLTQDFSRVDTTAIVWRNVPPAFAYVCYR